MPTLRFALVCCLLSFAARPDASAPPVPKPTTPVAHSVAATKPRPVKKAATIELDETRITSDAERPTVEIVLPRDPSIKDDLERAGEHQGPPAR